MSEPYCDYSLWHALTHVDLWKREYRNVEVSYQEVELVDIESFLNYKNKKE